MEVAWTGKFAAAMPLKGVEITWAHAPEEIRVLTSPDGSNFEEALCWKATGKDGEPFTETLMFSRALAQGARRRGAGSAWRCTALRR